LQLRSRTNNTRGISTAPKGTSLARRAIIALVAVGIGACATSHTVNVPLMEAHDLTAFLSDRDTGIHSMESAALMEYTGGGEHFKARENIIVRRPASMRVEVMSALGVALVVAADGGQVAVFDPGKNTLMAGPASESMLQRYARIPMTPDAAVRMMLGLAPDSAMLAFAPNSMTEIGDGKVLTYHEPGGVVDELGFNGEGNLEMVRETLADGRIGYEVHYSDYRKLDGGFIFPGQVDASFPKTGATVKFRYEDPSLNKDVPDSTFVLAPSPGTKRLTLGMERVTGGATRG
jgi:outer membrane lipoprotein-sorting protein